NQDFSEYTQTALGADFQLGFTFFEIVGEATYSLWNTPGYDENGFIETNPGELEEFTLSNLHANIDIKYEPPFFTGGYFAFRFDQARFFDASSENGTREDFMWDYNTTRLTALVGYKFDRNVLLKVALAEQGDFDGEFLSFKAYLTAGF
ncbi:MAG: hypothetical protein MI700_10615, partial [Balneolales bacterium]|nr:hypothetical protein [Balneolales bacterium]